MSGIGRGFSRERYMNIPEVVSNFDIGKLLLNEKMKEISKDASPLISGRKQISSSS